MPLGRIYQAPAVATVSRNTPVYGYNGLKSVNNSDLVITGKAVRSKNSKSPSPASKTALKPKISNDKSSSVSTNRTVSRKSPSPGKSVKQSTSKTIKIIKDKKDKDNKVNNNVESTNGKSENLKSSANSLNGDCNGDIDHKKEKSWSPELTTDDKVESTDNKYTNGCETEDKTDNGAHDEENNAIDAKEIECETLTNGNVEAHQLQNGHEKEESPVEESSSSVGGASGLRNIGNTCFMNSVIQCLSNTKLLTNYLLSDEHVREINTSNSSMKGSLIKAFATVIKSLWKSNGRVVDPSSLKGAVQRFAPRFSGYNQEDSQEFLRYLLEGLHEDVNRVLTKPQPIHTEIDSSLSVCEQAMEAWKRYIRRDDSHLVDLFVGQLKSTLRCSHCNHDSVTFEPFWDLSLGIPSKSGDVSLLDCLDSFTKEETLDGDEMPTCEQCKTRRKSTKRYSLYRLPKILVVHLKRFSPSDRCRQKLSSTVTFPLTGLNLSRYTDSVSNSSYNCYAISNHSGTLYSGHYTAYAKHSQSGQWHSYNDSRVSKCSSSNVISNEAYLLFFELS